MRVVITSTGKDLDSQVDSRFGRCPYYLVVEVEAGKIGKVDALENKAASSAHGAGFAAAQQVGDMKPDCVVTGNVGPNAARTLQEIGITVYQASGNVKEAIQQLIEGKLNRTGQTVQGHFGTGTEKAEASGSKGNRSTRKLAISTEDDHVAVHFGRCPQFTIIEIEDGKVVKKEIIDNPGHQPGYLPKFFSDMGIDYMIAGAAGPLAQDYFREYGIKLILGVQGKIDDVIRDFIEDRLEPGESIARPGEGKGYGIERTGEDK
jgi:predicted Fe-Mo cluster-binding NifX family protein